MKMKISFSKVLPYLVAILAFIVVSYVYFSPVLEGKRLNQHDYASFIGGAKEVKDFREDTGEEALWTNSMFVGMPSYLISADYKGNQLKFLDRLLQFGPRPASQLTLLLLGAFILMLSLRINPWLSIVGAFALAFSSYNFILIFAGHNTKVIAIAYAAPVIAGVLMSLRGRYLLGAALAGIFLSLQIRASHIQITYYTMIIIFFIGISGLIFAITEKRIKEFSISVGSLILVAGLAVLSNYSNLATTMEYSKYSMRAETELTKDEEDKTGGLGLSYATDWSYGIDETMTLLIPGFKGGSSTYELSEESETYKALEKLDKNFASQFIKSTNLYWGSQTSTSGPVYLGAIIIFLFVLGMFIVDKKYKWWILAVSVLAIMLSWGKNFMGLTEFFMNVVPGYNKFRTVSMTLVIPQLVMPILAFLALNKVIFGEIEKKKLFHALKWSAGITGGIALLFVLIPSFAGNFISPIDQRIVEMYSNGNPQVRQLLTDNLLPALESDRENMVRMDSLRSAIFIILTAGFIYLLRIRDQKMDMKIVIGVFALLFVADMWPVDKRFLNDNKFEAKASVEKPFPKTAADQAILDSHGLNERVLNLTVSTFQDASTSYYHQSLGGYHGAKMRRYQDLIDTRLMDEMSMLIQPLQRQNFDMLDSVMAKLNIINMLNTRYIILNPNGAPLVNQFAKGNAWFVSEFRLADNADQELDLTSTLNLDRIAVLDKKYSTFVEGRTYSYDSSATISLVEYQPNKLVYNSSSASEQIAVFSEIFYDKGWNAYIDDEARDHFRADYTLRGLVIPEGEHTIVFEFKPKTYYRGEKIAFAGSFLLILLLIGSLYYEWKGLNEED